MFSLRVFLCLHFFFFALLARFSVVVLSLCKLFCDLVFQIDMNTSIRSVVVVTGILYTIFIQHQKHHQMYYYQSLQYTA